MPGRKKSNTLKGRDLINIGIFSAVYFVLSFIWMLLSGLHPLIWTFLPAFTALTGAIPYMLLTAKVKKPFAVIMMGAIVGLIYVLTGQISILVLILYLCGAVIAEIIRYFSKYSNFWLNAVGFGFFSFGMAGSPLPLWLYRESFFEQISEFGMPADYLNQLEALASPGLLPIMLVVTFVAAILGAFLARRLFKKHFQKAGVVYS